MDDISVSDRENGSSHTRSLEADFRLITQESPGFIHGECKIKGVVLLVNSLPLFVTMILIYIHLKS